MPPFVQDVFRTAATRAYAVRDTGVQLRAVNEGVENYEALEPGLSPQNGAFDEEEVCCEVPFNLPFLSIL